MSLYVIVKVIPPLIKLLLLIVGLDFCCLTTRSSYLTKVTPSYVYAIAWRDLSLIVRSKVIVTSY